MADTVGAWQADLLGVAITGYGPYEVPIPAAFQTGHEAHFSRVLDEFLRIIDEARSPPALVTRTPAKYELLPEAAVSVGADRPLVAGSPAS